MLQLMRIHQPVGFGLLLWPALWAVWVASHGQPDPKVVLCFVAGSLLMRSAGCAINDLADRHIDGGVVRTHSRPLACGACSVWTARLLVVGLLTAAAALAWSLGPQVFFLALVGAGLTLVYPWMKRWIDAPQAVLGVAFAWSVPMAFQTIQGEIPAEGWQLFVLVAIWPVAYDTLYAMADRADDVRMGVRSLALTLGHYDRAVIIGLEGAFYAGLLGFAWVYRLPILVHMAIWGAIGLTAWAILQTQDRSPERCLMAFRLHQWMGFLIFIGFLASGHF